MSDSNEHLVSPGEIAGASENSSTGSRRQHSSYTQELADRICERVAMGQSLRQICRDPGMPARSSIFEWLKRDKVFLRKYRLAKQVQIQDLCDEILEIADDSSNDWIEHSREDGQIRRVFNRDNMRRAKLRIAARKWHLARLMPKKYGFEYPAR